MLQSDLCNFSDAYIVVKGTITVYKRESANRNIDTFNRKLVLNNCTPFTTLREEILAGRKFGKFCGFDKNPAN